MDDHHLGYITKMKKKNKTGVEHKVPHNSWLWIVNLYHPSNYVHDTSGAIIGSATLSYRVRDHMIKVSK
jgi:hypothetical protein